MDDIAIFLISEGANMSARDTMVVINVYEINGSLLTIEIKNRCTDPLWSSGKILKLQTH